MSAFVRLVPWVGHVTMVTAALTGNVASGIGPSKIGGPPTSFNDPSREAGKEVRRGSTTR